MEVFSNGVQAVAAGDWHSMVLKDDDSLWGTGRNLHGQLGDGSTIAQNKYVRILPLHGECRIVLLKPKIVTA